MTSAVDSVAGAPIPAASARSQMVRMNPDRALRMREVVTQAADMNLEMNKVSGW
jgi:hypothetical protein